MRLSSIIWSLLGLIVPLLIAAVTIPELISQIGQERFGFLALAWGLVGYAGVLDLGVGRALTQKVSAIRGGVRDSEIPALVKTALYITAVVGLLGLIVLLFGAAFGLQNLVSRQDVSDTELLLSAVILSFALPLQAISATYKGVNEAFLKFREISWLRIALGAANFGGPFVVAMYSSSLFWLVSTLVFSRMLALGCYRHLAKKCLSYIQVSQRPTLNSAYASELINFGGWLTLSSLVSPILVQADRFFIGVILSASAVTLYVIPYEISMQSLVLVSAISTVAFPAIANLHQTNIGEAKRVFELWFRRVFFGMALFMLLLGVSFSYILNAWVGEHVSAESVVVARILCFGVFVNSVGVMYYAQLHAFGKTKQTAILHLAELPIFLIALTVLISQYGVIGAACAWVLRVALDTIGLYWLTKRYFGTL